MAENLLMGIALLLIGAKLLGYLFEKLGLSSLIGEILAGIILGPAIFGLVKPGEQLGQIANFGILFFLFLIGLSTRLDDFKQKIYQGSAIAVAGALASFAAGFLIGYLGFGSVPAAIFLGVAFTSSSTVISLRLLSGMRGSIAKSYIIPVAIADDVIAILAIALFGTYISLGTIQLAQGFTLFLAVIGFFLLLLTFGSRVLNYVLSLGQNAEHDEHMIISIALAVLFIIAFISEQVGIAAVTGAFLAGMAMSGSSVAQREILPKAKIIGHSLFIPIFFAYSALSIDIFGVANSIFMVALVAGAAIATKIIACSHVSKVLGLPKIESRIIGFAMSPRGEYSIIVAQIALAAGAITAQQYSVALAAVAVTIIAGPLLMKFFTK